MTSLTVAALVFAFTFSGALAGLALHSRLPSHHIDSDSRDVIKLVMGLVATVSALVLGLLISSAHRAYETQDSEVQQIGIHLFQLDRALERYGPEASEARAMLRQLVRGELESASINGKARTDLPLQAQKGASLLFDTIAGLTPKTEPQRFIQSRAIALLDGLANTRLLLNEQARSAISWPFLVVLVFWLTVLFVGFGLFARRNGTIVTTLCLGALSVAGAVFLILEMNRPHTGVMQISIEPIRNALQQMGR